MVPKTAFSALVALVLALVALVLALALTFLIFLA